MSVQSHKKKLRRWKLAWLTKERSETESFFKIIGFTQKRRQAKIKLEILQSINKSFAGVVADEASEWQLVLGFPSKTDSIQGMAEQTLKNLSVGKLI